MKKSIILLLASILIIVLFGCHSGGGGGSSPFSTSNNTDKNITSKKVIVKANGRFQDIIFPSGTLIKCTEDDTLHEGAVVTATEEKNSAEKVESGMPLYVYRISAVLHSSNNLADDVVAATIKKPLTVSFPNDTDSGLCYAGIRTDSEDSWRFSFITDSYIDNPDILSMRLSQNSPNPCTFNLYRLGVEFALFVFKNEGESNSNVEVDVLIPPEKTLVQIKDKKYAEDLKVKFTLKGLNLGCLIDKNLNARITYRSAKATPSDFKVSSLKIKQETFNDKAVSGVYAHSFIVPSLKINSTMNNEAVVSYVINIKGISLEDFPNEFIVEIYSRDLGDNIKPFIYTQTFGFETEEKEDTPDKPEQPEQPENPEQPEQTPESYIITYKLNGGELAKINPETYTSASETFTLNNPTKDGYTFIGWTGSNGEEPRIIVKIEKGSEGDKSFTANYAAVEYRITYNLGADNVENNNPTGYNTASETFVLSEPIREGYTFIGWSGSNGDTPQLKVSIEKGSTGDKEYRANFSPVSYRIAYTLNDGLVADANPESYDITSTTITLNNPSKDYYNFVGWTGTGLNSASTTLSIVKGSMGDKYYVANYIPINFSIAYELNGGRLTRANPTSYDITSSTITLNNPIRNGYIFKGWSGTGLTGDENTSVNIPQGSNGNRSYTANWLNHAVLSLKSASTSFQLDGNIQLEFDREFTWLNSYKDNISITPAKTISSCSLNGRVLTLVLADSLDYDTSYTLRVSGIEGVADKSFTINTIAKAVISLESSADAFAGSDTIRLDFDHEIDWQDSYINSITIAPTTQTSPSLTINSCSYSNKVLSINLSDKLQYDTSYNIGVNGLEGVTDNNLALAITPLIVEPIILPAESSIDKTRNNHCILRPEFSIDFGKKLLNTNNIINKIQLNDAALPNSCTLVFEENGRIASLTFAEDFELFTDYRLSTIAFSDEDNSSISASELSFKTIPSDDFRGSGTSNDPYLIYTEAHLNKLRETTPTNYLGGDFYYKQMDDIVLTSDWVPIGDKNNKFTGNYNGNDKTISNMRIPYEYNENPSPNTRYVGLFGYNNGTISRVNINNVIINIDSDFFYYAGCLVGENYGSIEYCSVSSASVKIHTERQTVIGGICGSNYGSVGSCSLEVAKLECFGSSYAEYITIGGIVAYHMSSNNIDSCKVTDIDIRGSSTGNLSQNRVGGICGYNSSNSCLITKCKVSSSGNHKLIGSAEGYCYVGGIIGYMGSYNMSLCSVTGYEITGYAERECHVGGLSGQKNFYNTAISKSYVDNCVITGTGNNNYVGGLCGDLTGQIVSCYVLNTSVRGMGDINCVGGLCGYTSNKCSLSGCYVYEDSSHDISGSNSGFLVGLLYRDTSDQSKNSTISDSFFNKETTNLVNRVGNYTTNSAPEEGYAYIKNCYDSIGSFDAYKTLQWSDGRSYSAYNSVWKDYNKSANQWPPDLKELPRGN